MKELMSFDLAASREEQALSMTEAEAKTDAAKKSFELLVNKMVLGEEAGLLKTVVLSDSNPHF